MFGIVKDVPATEEMYRTVTGKLGTEKPAGLVAHIAVRRDGGLRYIEVWASEEDHRRFTDERLNPIVDEMLAGYGIERDDSEVQLETLDVVGTWA